MSAPMFEYQAWFGKEGFWFPTNAPISGGYEVRRRVVGPWEIVERGDDE